MSKKFKYFVTYLHQKTVNNKYDAINILRIYDAIKIYDKNSYIECELIDVVDNIVIMHYMQTK